jgi:hypothetical protein
MAMLSSVNQRKPNWIRAELNDDYRDGCVYADIGIRCRDGWVHVMHSKLTYYQHNDIDMRKTRRELLEELHQHITLELATLTLEET